MPGSTSGEAFKDQDRLAIDQRADGEETTGHAPAVEKPFVAVRIDALQVNERAALIVHRDDEIVGAVLPPRAVRLDLLSVRVRVVRVALRLFPHVGDPGSRLGGQAVALRLALRLGGPALLV